MLDHFLRHSLLYSLAGLSLTGASTIWLIIGIKKRRFSSYSIIPLIILLIIGGFLGLQSLGVTYYYSEKYRIVGFPMMLASLEKRDNRWIDFIEAQMPLAALINLLFWLCAPTLFMTVYLEIKRAFMPCQNQSPHNSN